jgi:hypothetical protein
MKMLAKASAYQLTIWGKDALRAVVTSGILKTRSGHLMRNVNMLVEEAQDSSRLTLGTNVAGSKPVKYARILEEGGRTKPHVIKPVMANVLAFQVGSRTVFAKKVNHPGSNIPAFHWLSAPLNVAKPELDRMLSAEELLSIAQALG